ncbi:MAG: nascent polypeptide-associated complex protein [Candidatus Pacearchaeota archaeon]
MFGNFNPKQIEGLMKKMGIAQNEIHAKRVIIECENKNIIIDNPSVIQIKMQGNESFQISGDISEEEFLFNEEDIKLIMEKTKKSREEVVKFLEKNDGDIAQTILDLSSSN